MGDGENKESTALHLCLTTILWVEKENKYKKNKGSIWYWVHLAESQTESICTK